MRFFGFVFPTRFVDFFDLSLGLVGFRLCEV